MRVIVLTGGGTAGHVMPNIALLPLLRTYFDRIYYIGTKNGIERELIKKEKDVEYIEINAVKLIRKLTLKNFLIPFKLCRTIKKCKKILKELKPNIIFSKGGFVSVPVCIAGKKINIPIVSHESDFSLGLANKIIYHYSTKFLTSFSTTKEGKKKIVYTGLPLRKKIINGNKQNVAKLFSPAPNKTNIIIFGGSLGAKQINNLTKECLDELTKKYNIVHIVGKGNLVNNIVQENYLQLEFVDAIEDCYAFADMSISRSGATTIFELLEVKKPMLLIPLSKKESRGDQIENARYMKDKNLAIVLEKDDISKNDFLQAIAKLEKQKNILNANMQKQSTNNTLERVFEIIKQESSVQK